MICKFNSNSNRSVPFTFVKFLVDHRENKILPIWYLLYVCHGCVRDGRVVPVPEVEGGEDGADAAAEVVTAELWEETEAVRIKRVFKLS